MNRKEFLYRLGALTATSQLAGRALASAPLQTIDAELTISSNAAARPVPRTYTGLSYELAQLSEPDFFSAENHDLVAYFRLLSKQGVLRLGGNTSEFCWFRATAATQPPRLHLPAKLDANWMPHRLFEIPPQSIDNLAAFLDATGWRLIYGLNFGNSTPERAAVEATYVAQKLGPHLEFFQIGNEPDFYRDANNGTRPPGWDFPDYATEWLRIADAVTTAVPNARFGGPDVGASSDWIARFANEVAPKLGRRLVAVTGHYYAEGPPNDPRVTTARLLAGDAAIPAQMQQIEAVAQIHSLVYRMTEGNSCYRGGKPGMSNAFTSALWAGDYMLQLASLGCAGVNLHGGDSRFLTAGLGGHTPGLDVARQPQSMPSGFYTPIATERGTLPKAMPIYYGMMLANQFAGATFVKSELRTDANATAYAAIVEGQYRVAVFNKGASHAISVAIRLASAAKKATAWRLEGPSLDATEGVTLAGSSVGSHAQWAPKKIEQLIVENGAVSMRIPAASAVLLFIE
jgi:Glycosyl hydrolase family 79 C-terminal beta domain